MKFPAELSRIPVVTRITVITSTLLSTIFWLTQYGSVLQSQGEDPGEYSDHGSPFAPYLVMVPRYSYYLLWTFGTSSFVSANIFTLGMTLATLLLGGRYLERAFSSRELIRFYSVVVLIPNFLVFLGLVLLWSLTKNAMWLETTVYGSVAIQAGILVAFKQLVPEHTITLYKKLVKVRVKHFPALFLLSTMISAPILQDYSAIVTSFFGFFSSWIYLRFYKASPPDLEAPGITLRGDASETFALSQFFPDVFHGPIDRLSAIIFDALIQIRVCMPLETNGAETLNQFGHKITGPGLGRAETERRRTAALRALDQKMARDTQRVLPGQDSESVALPPQVNH